MAGLMVNSTRASWRSKRELVRTRSAASRAVQVHCLGSYHRRQTCLHRTCYSSQLHVTQESCSRTHKSCSNTHEHTLRLSGSAVPDFTRGLMLAGKSLRAAVRARVLDDDLAFALAGFAHSDPDAGEVQVSHRARGGPQGYARSCQLGFTDHCHHRWLCKASIWATVPAVQLCCCARGAVVMQPSHFFFICLPHAHDATTMQALAPCPSARGSHS